MLISRPRHRMFRRAALDYAAHGWPIFPLKPGSRMALLESGASAATTNRSQIKRWWSHWPAANIGLDCARAGVVALVLDPYHGAIAAWPALNLSARTSTCWSRAGFVLIYGLPVGHKPLRSAGPMLASGVTVHAAGEHIVLPPSVLSRDDLVRWLEFSESWRPSRALRVLPDSVLPFLLPASHAHLRLSARSRRAWRLIRHNAAVRSARRGVRGESLSPFMNLSSPTPPPHAAPSRRATAAAHRRGGSRRPASAA